MSMSDAQQKLIEVLPELKGRLPGIRTIKRLSMGPRQERRGIALDLICA